MRQVLFLSVIMALLSMVFVQAASADGCKLLQTTVEGRFLFCPVSDNSVSAKEIPEGYTWLPSLDLCTAEQLKKGCKDVVQGEEYDCDCSSAGKVKTR